MATTAAQVFLQLEVWFGRLIVFSLVFNFVTELLESLELKEGKKFSGKNRHLGNICKWF